ncbi:MAG: hypothetical protein ACRDZU_02485 [Acidimicrobiales bacterium]
MAGRYQRPTIWELGTVRDLTQAPPGKTGTEHDSSQFQMNFSCVGKDHNNCGDH